MYTQIRAYAGEKELLITCNIDYDGKSVSLSLSGVDIRIHFNEEEFDNFAKKINYLNSITNDLED